MDTPQDTAARPVGSVDATAWCALVLGVAGVLPALPLVGSFAAMVCAGIWLHGHDLDAPGRTATLAGLLLGVLGILVPLASAVLAYRS
jgi:hypothetical protein